MFNIISRYLCSRECRRQRRDSFSVRHYFVVSRKIGYIILCRPVAYLRGGGIWRPKYQIMYTIQHVYNNMNIIWRAHWMFTKNFISSPLEKNPRYATAADATSIVTTDCVLTFGLFLQSVSLSYTHLTYSSSIHIRHTSRGLLSSENMRYWTHLKASTNLRRYNVQAYYVLST